MKKTFLFIILSLSVLKLMAQVPPRMNYQAVARDAAGAIMASTNVCIKFIITDGNGGPQLYTETDNLNTNQFGLFTTKVGDFDSAAYISIPWRTVNPWLNVQMDAGCTGTFTDMGSSEILSVPYALFSADNQWSKSGSSIYNNNNGRVGIGTSTPDARLNVVESGASDMAGHFSIDNSSNGSNVIQATTLGNGNALSGATNGAGIAVMGYTTGTGYAGFFQVDNAANSVYALGAFSNGSGPAAFFSNIGTGPALRTGNGNVGIGTANPQQKLDVNGTIRAYGLENDQVNDFAIVSTASILSSALMYAWYNDASELMRLTYGGQLGIGITSPLQALHVNGGICIADASGAYSGSIRYHNNDFEGYNGQLWQSFIRQAHQNITHLNQFFTERNQPVYSSDSIVVAETGTYLVTLNASGVNGNEYSTTAPDYDVSASADVYKVGYGAITPGVSIFERYLDQGQVDNYFRYISQSSSYSNYYLLMAGDVLKVEAAVTSTGSPTTPWGLASHNISIVKVGP